MLTGKEANDPGARNWLGRSRCQVQRGEEGSRGRATGQGGQCCGPDTSHTAASPVAWRPGEQGRQGGACGRRCPEALPPGGQPCPAWQVPTLGLGPSAETGAGRPGGKRPCGPLGTDTATRLVPGSNRWHRTLPSREQGSSPPHPPGEGPRPQGRVDRGDGPAGEGGGTPPGSFGDPPVLCLCGIPGPATQVQMRWTEQGTERVISQDTPSPQ